MALLFHGSPLSWLSMAFLWPNSAAELSRAEVPTFSLPAPENCGEFIISATWIGDHHGVGGWQDFPCAIRTERFTPLMPPELV